MASIKEILSSYGSAARANCLVKNIVCLTEPFMKENKNEC